MACLGQKRQISFQDSSLLWLICTFCAYYDVVFIVHVRIDEVLRFCIYLRDCIYICTHNILD